MSVARARAIVRRRTSTRNGRRPTSARCWFRRATTWRSASAIAVVSAAATGGAAGRGGAAARGGRGARGGGVGKEEGADEGEQGDAADDGRHGAGLGTPQRPRAGDPDRSS